jgi:cell division protein FtsN
MMKNLVLFTSILMLSFSACKTSKTLSKSAYEPAVNNQVETSLSEMAAEPEKVQEPEPAIVVRTEAVSIERSDDNTLHAFYVIVGSFSMVENAYKLQNELLANGIPSEVLKTETGMMRVSYLGTDRENEAREKISEIRTKLPQFNDVWLLKRK